MKEKRVIKWVMVLLFATLMVQSAFADIYMKQKQHTDAVTIMGQTQPATDLINEIWLTADKVVVLSGQQKTIMNIDKKTMTMVDHQKKSIIEIPMDFSKGMSKEKDMSAEEKAQFQKMMGKMMQMDIKVEETNEKKKIGKWNCRKYLQTTKMAFGTITSKIWATEDIEVDTDLYAEYTVGMLSKVPGMNQNMHAIKQEIKKIKGVQVYSEQHTMMMGQTMKSSLELIEFKKGNAPDGLFDQPAGYQKKSI